MTDIISPEGIFSYTLQHVGPPPRARQSAPASPRRNHSTYRNSHPQKTQRGQGNMPHDAQEGEFYNDPRLELWACRALNEEDISGCEPDLIPDLIDTLSQQWEFSVTNNYYFMSEKAKNAYERAKKLEIDTNNRRFQAMIQNDLKNRKDDYQHDKKDFENLTETLEKNMEKEFSDKIEELINRHDDELKRFYDDWGSVRRRIYNKPSRELYDLRYQEEKLLSTRRYTESQQVGSFADQKEVKEVSSKVTNMEYDFKIALSSLIQRQREEMRLLRSRQREERDIFSGTKRNESETMAQRLRKLNMECEKANDMKSVKRKQLKYRRGPPRYCSLALGRLPQKEVTVAEFNEVPLPPLNAAQRIQEAIARRSAGVNGKIREYNQRFSVVNSMSNTMTDV